MKEIITDGQVVRKWEHKGIPCVLVVNPGGGCNGYIQLPANSPKSWLGRDPELVIPVNPSGGLTYPPDSSRWIGFDTLHAGDCWKGSVYASEDKRALWSWYHQDGKNPWDEDRVARECERMCEDILAYFDRLVEEVSYQAIKLIAGELGFSHITEAERFSTEHSLIYAAVKEIKRKLDEK